MITREKERFLGFLTGREAGPVLFEPFLSRRHTETLIWRRGPRLWDTPEHEIATLIAATERTGSDFVWIDLRNRTRDEKQALTGEVPVWRGDYPFLGFGFMADSPQDVLLAEEAGDALALWGDVISEKLPVIRMDGGIREAIGRGDAGWFARSGAEEALEEAGGRIRILGGLGMDRLSLPAPLYARVEALDGAFRGQWAVGSGGIVADEDYLGLIAMLGAYARIREKAERDTAGLLSKS